MIFSLLVSVSLYKAQPRQRIIAAAVCMTTIVTIAVQDREPVDFEEITTGFMIWQLIDAKSLIADKGKFPFAHGQNQTTLEELADIAETE